MLWIILFAVLVVVVGTEFSIHKSWAKIRACPIFHICMALWIFTAIAAVAFYS